MDTSTDRNADREQETDRATVQEAAGNAAPGCGQGSCGCGGAGIRTKQRSEKEHRDLINRLSRIEGQIRGIKGMVERDVYCADILTQVTAVTSALNSFNRVLLEAHMKTCVTRDIKEGREETVDELLAILQKMIR